MAGVVRFPNHALNLPFIKAHHGPQWGFTATARVDGEVEAVSLHASLVGAIPDEPESMGWLDRSDDGFSGKFVVGADWENIIRQAAFSPVSWDFEISFAVDAEGEITRLTLGMSRRSVEA